MCKVYAFYNYQWAACIRKQHKQKYINTMYIFYNQFIMFENINEIGKSSMLNPNKIIVSSMSTNFEMKVLDNYRILGYNDYVRTHKNGYTFCLDRSKARHESSILCLVCYTFFFIYSYKRFDPFVHPYICSHYFLFLIFF